jgi:polyisoprenoid-binding protein YceI
MNVRDQLRRPRTWLIGVPVLVVVLALVGPFVWFRIIKDDPPPPLSFADVSTPTTVVGATTSTTLDDPAVTVLGRTATTARAVATTVRAGTTASEVEGPWRIATGSIAGYRIRETVGFTTQDAVGRTDKITGTMRIAGTTVESGSWTVDMVSVKSDDERRDQNYRANMAVDEYPTSLFVLGAPIALESVPPDGADITVSVKGSLTLRGQTRPVAFTLQARRKNNRIETVGNIHVRFADYGIPNPSNGYARTDDEGLVEFLLLFERG